MSDSLRVVAAEQIANDRQWEHEVEHRGFKVAELRKVFDAVCNADDWKAPVAVSVPHQHVAIVQAAVEYFQADTPEVDGIVPLSGHVRLVGRGYQA